MHSGSRPWVAKLVHWLKVWQALCQNLLRRIQSILRRVRVPTFKWHVAWVALPIFLAITLYVTLPVSLSQSGEVFFRVNSGAGARIIGRELKQQGIIRSADVFALWARLLGAQGKLQAGDYKLHPGLTPMQIVWRIKTGRVASAGITIPEGYNLTQIAETLATARLVSKEEFLAMAAQGKDALGEQSALNPPTGSLEGYLFPDTYRIAPGTATVEILRSMLKRTEEKVLPLVQEAKLAPGFTLHEMFTLASIVEKEAKVEEERPLIAGVFYNRLARGIPLQSDPTVKYVLSPAPLRLSRDDIAIDSPYNTYRYKGLPPGPISNPGLASIKAVLEPAKTTYLYFVARGDGTHVFTNTYKEHLAARKEVGM